MEQQSSARCSVHLRLVSHRLSAMATRDERVVAHAKELQDFMRSQEPVLSKQKYETLIDKQFGELKKQLGAAPLSPKGCMELTQRLRQFAWGDDKMSEFSDLMQDAISKGSIAKPTKRANQTVTDWMPYWSVKDLEVLGGTDVSLACKRDTIIVRMLRCGLHLPAEAAWREVIRSAQACGVDWPGDPTQHYQLLLDMKRSLKQRVRNTEKPEPFIEAFSGNVSKIPASAYTDSPPGKRLSDASHLGQWMP